MNQDELLHHIEKLKAENRRIFGFSILVACLFVVAWAYDNVRVQKRVKAREFILLSDSGETVARLRQEGTGACLDLIGPSQTAGAAICAADSLGSYVSLSNGNGKIHAVLSAGMQLVESQQDNFPPGLLISESNGERLLHVTVGSDSKILFGDSSGENTLVVTIPKSGRPTAVLKSSNRNP